jgi:hypothetical protein
MQLRAARLCLDCEEIFVGDVCPICASQQTAFLTSWLPVEERRKWRRPAPEPVTATERRLTAVRQFFRNIFGDGTPVRAPGPPRTRRSDNLPPMDFDGPAKPQPTANPVAEQRPIKGDVR